MEEKETAKFSVRVDEKEELTTEFSGSGLIIYAAILAGVDSLIRKMSNNNPKSYEDLKNAFMAQVASLKFEREG